VLAGITLAALAARWWQARESLWIDELHTAWTVSAGLGQVAERARLGNNSPLYFYLVWAVTRVLGMSEPALRGLSLVAGTAVIPLVYGLVRRWSATPLPPLLAAALTAIDGNQLFFSLEARPYALVQLVALGQLIVWDRLVERPTAGRRTMHVVLAIGLFYLHYTAVLLVAAELAYYVLRRCVPQLRPGYLPRQVLQDLAVVAVCCLPAVPHLAEIAARRENWRRFVAIPEVRDALEIYPLHTYLGLPLLVVSLLGAVRWLGGFRPALVRVDRRGALLCVAWFCVPLALAWLATWTDVARIFFRRYVLVAALAPAAASGLLATALPSSRLQVVLGGVLLGVGAWTVGPGIPLVRDGRLVRHSDEDWRAVAAQVHRSLGYRRLPVFVASGLIEADGLRQSDDPRLRDYCLLPLGSIYRLEDRMAELVPLPLTGPGRLTGSQWELLERRGGGWFVLRGTQEAAELAIAALQRGLKRRGRESVVRQRVDGGLVTAVELLALPPPAGAPRIPASRPGGPLDGDELPR